MTLTMFERIVAIVLCAEAFALAYFALCGLALWVMHRFPARTPYPDQTLAQPGGRVARALLRQRSWVALLAATGLVLALAVTTLAFTFTWRIPFVPLWWVKWLLILVAPFALWGYGWIVVRAVREFLRLRRTWHAQLAVAGVLKSFALSGHQTFHDVAIGELVIDHVVVGPRGVFLVNVAVRPRPAAAANAVVKLLPVERQLDLGVAREFEAVFAATRRVTEMSRVLEKMLGHKIRPVSAIVVPGWETAPTEDGDHLLFSLSSMASMLSWAKPHNGLLTEDLPALNKQLLAAQRVERPL